MTKTDLFLELAKPNENGVSRWVEIAEFTGKYKDLQSSVRKISKEVCDDILKKLYPEDN